MNPAVSRAIRFTCIQAAQSGYYFAGDSSHDRVPAGVSRSTSIRNFIDMDIDGLLWIDSDMKPESWHATHLLGLARQHDFVTGLYFRRNAPHNPLIYSWDEKQQGFACVKRFPYRSLYHVDGCGFGFCYTSIRMLQDMMLVKSFNPDVGWFPDRRDVGGFGEDLGFCDLVRRAGYRPTVDTSLIVGHQADAKFIGIDDFTGENK